MRGGAVAARRAHNPKAIGSSPVPATSDNQSPSGSGFSFTLSNFHENF